MKARDIQIGGDHYMQKLIELENRKLDAGCRGA